MPLHCLLVESIRLPDAERYATLVAVTEAGSFRGAALERHLAPSTVQKQMRALEKDLNITLFERSGREIVVRPLAFELAAVAGEALAACSRLGQHVERLRSGLQDCVHVICAPIHLARSMGIIARLFEERTGHPVRITLRQQDQFADTFELAELLRTGACDVVVTLSDLEECESVAMWSTSLVAVVPDTFSSQVCRMSDLQGETVFAQQPHLWSRRTLENVAESESAALTIVTEPLPEVCLSLAKANLGIAVVADDNLTGDENARPVVTADGVQPVNTVKAHRYKHANSKLTHEFLTFVDEFHRQLQTSR